MPRRIVTRVFSVENILLSTIDSVGPKSSRFDPTPRNFLAFEERFVRV